jgi:hypothetical protein
MEWSGRRVAAKSSHNIISSSSISISQAISTSFLLVSFLALACEAEITARIVLILQARLPPSLLSYASSARSARLNRRPPLLFLHVIPDLPAHLKIVRAALRILTPDNVNTASLASPEEVVASKREERRKGGGREENGGKAEGDDLGVREDEIDEVF